MKYAHIIEYRIYIIFCELQKAQQYPPGTQEKYNSFQSKIPVMKDGMKTVVTKRRGGVWILITGGSPKKGAKHYIKLVFLLRLDFLNRVFLFFFDFFFMPPI